MKYKILYVNLFPEIGGAETSLTYLIQTLNKKLFQPIVILPQPGNFSERLKKFNVPIIFLNLPGYLIRTLFLPGAHPVAIWHFFRLCQQLKPDLIHLNHLTQAVYAGIASKLLKIPVVATSWMNSDSIYFYQDVITNIFVDKILLVSYRLANRFVHHHIVNPGKLTVIFPGVDTIFFKPTKNKIKAKRKLKINPKDLVISIVSRFDPTKDHITFLKAIKIVVQQYPQITILIANDPQINLGDENQAAVDVKKNVNQYLKNQPQLAQHVIFTGYQSNILPLCQATDILVNSSHYESLGISLIEAAACSLPIVSTDYEGQHYVITNNQTGFLVPIREPQIMAEKILQLINNKKLRTEFGRKARIHAVDNFSVKRYAAKIENVYLSLLKVEK